MTARDKFLAMAFAQITFRESLRDIEACLKGCSHLYGMGVRGNVTRTNLAYANEYRDWRVYEALAQVLISKARRLYREDYNGLDIDEMAYAVDSSTIDLCLSMFPWANFRKKKQRSSFTLKSILPGRSLCLCRLQTVWFMTSTSCIRCSLKLAVFMSSTAYTFTWRCNKLSVN
jgi:hypothetical protein